MLWPLLLLLLGALAPATPVQDDRVCGWNLDQLQADTPRSKQVGGEIEPGAYNMELTIRWLNTAEAATARTFLTEVEQ